MLDQSREHVEDTHRKFYYSLVVLDMHIHLPVLWRVHDGDTGEKERTVAEPMEALKEFRDAFNLGLCFNNSMSLDGDGKPYQRLPMIVVHEEYPIKMDQAK